MLLDSKFFAFTPRDEEAASCSFDDILVCKSYKDLVSGLTLDWNSDALKNCTGLSSTLKPDDFQAPDEDSSDLYRYLQIYTLGWLMAQIFVVSLFSYIKLSTKFDAIFFQPNGREKNILFRFFAPQTPFS